MSGLVRGAVLAAIAAVTLMYGLASAQPPDPLPEPAEPPQSQALPPEALEGQEEGEQRHAAAEALAEAVRDWTDCIAENAAAQGDEETRQEEPFDPTAACPEKPDPADFGLIEPPEGTPQGPPEGTPQGPPEGTPQGPPEGTPQGPPGG
jgi:hypothetical protein